MSIIYSKNRGGIPTIAHDPSNKELYTFYYRPATWVASKEVISGRYIYMPTIPNGRMYIATNSGITGTTEPIWASFPSDVTDGSVIYEVKDYNLELNTGDAIQADTDNAVPAFNIIVPTGFVVDSGALLGTNSIQFRVTTAPLSGIYPITVQVSILKASGVYILHEDTINLEMI